MNNSEFFSEAEKYFPGGFSSPVKIFRPVGGNPVFFKKGMGAYLQDLEGNIFLDLQNYSNLLGYGSEVFSENTEGFFKNLFSENVELELQFAEKFTTLIPNTELIKFFPSESEACDKAIQLARSYTQRKKILKFSGCFHGDSVSLLKDSGASDFLGINLNSAGVPTEVSALTLVSEFNNIEDFEYLISKNKNEIAAVIIEPVAVNMGCVPAENSFLQSIRKICSEENILLIFDETKTGFRISVSGAQQVYQIPADLLVYGSTVTAGIPFGILGGKKEVMQKFSPLGDVFAEGYVGNSLPFFMGLKTLEALQTNPDFILQMNDQAEQIDFEIGKILNRKNIQHRINRKGSVLSLFFHATKVSNYKDADFSNTSLYNTFFHHCLKHGISLPPHALKAWFVPGSLKDSDITKILSCVENFEFS